ncbi:MAG: hypothetical protein M1818_001297 [Claussenomyces sp. TS43310]|nr:MAG: hypothetical protein M1818_001297 [Claussenomyces sp. TS43310]
MSTVNKRPVSILPLTAPDLPAFAQNLRQSKYELTINRLLYNNWPNASAQLAQCTKAVQGSANDADSSTWKVVDDETKEMVGHFALTWKAPSKIEDVKQDGKDEFYPPVPDGMNEDVFRAVIKAVRDIQTLGDVERFVVTHIWLKPSHRRSGIGSQLMRLAMDKAGEARLPLSVSSEPVAHGFFLSLGFKDTKYADIDLTKWAEENSGFGVFRLTGMVLDK